MKKLCRLGEAVKAISPRAEIRFKGIPDREDWWVCVISVGDVILAESAAGPLDTVLTEVTKKVQGMSQRIRAVLAPNSIPPPPDTSSDPDDSV